MDKYSRYLLFVWLMVSAFIPQKISAQASTTDSLLLLLKNANEDSNKVQLLLKLTISYRISDPDSALFFTKQALRLSKKINDYKGRVYCLINWAVYYHYQGNYFEALKYYQKARNASEKVEDPKVTSDIYNNIAVTYFFMGAHKEALENYHKALKIAEHLDNKTAISKILANMGMSHCEMKNYSHAQNYFLSSLKYGQYMEGSASEASINNSLGLLYLETHRDSLALVYLKTALKGFRNNDNKYGMARAFNNIGSAMLNKKEYDSAHHYFLLSYDLKKETQDNEGTVSALNNLAKVNYYWASQSIHPLQREQFFNKTIEYATKALNMANEMKVLKGQKESYQNLIYGYWGKRNFDKSLECYEKYVQTNDSLYNKEKANAIEKLEARYQFEKKQKQIEVLEKENTIKDVLLQKRKTLLYSLALILTISIAFFLSIFILNKKKLKAYHNLVSKNVELARAEIAEKLPGQPLPERDNMMLTGKYHYTKLKKEDKKQIASNVVTVLKNKKLFLEKECSLDMLANCMKTNKLYISQAINQELKTNFNNLVNELRVQEAIRILSFLEDKKFTLEAISEQAGFNSRDTFVRAFKKFTGLTPSFFLKSMGN